MKKKILVTLWIAAGILTLCACQQAAVMASALPERVVMADNNIAASAAPSAAESASPKVSLFPMPTSSPARDLSYKLFPMPTPTAVPTATPSPTPSLAPTPAPTPYATPSLPPLPSYAPVPKSIPFTVSTPTPAATAEPAPEAPAEPATPAPTTAPAVEPPPSSGGSATGQEIADFAMQYVGYTYVYGGKSPEEGFDCSGLVYYVYSQFGYSINRTASDQSYSGTHVEHSYIQPGDILCFYTSGSYIGHSGIYLGGGNYIHARGTGYGVVVSPLSERGESYEARRVVS